MQLENLQTLLRQMDFQTKPKDKKERDRLKASYSEILEKIHFCGPIMRKKAMAVLANDVQLSQKVQCACSECKHPRSMRCECVVKVAAEQNRGAQDQAAAPEVQCRTFTLGMLHVYAAQTASEQDRNRLRQLLDEFEASLTTPDNMEQIMSRKAPIDAFVGEKYFELCALLVDTRADERNPAPAQPPKCTNCRVQFVDQRLTTENLRLISDAFSDKDHIVAYEELIAGETLDVLERTIPPCPTEAEQQIANARASIIKNMPDLDATVNSLLGYPANMHQILTALRTTESVFTDEQINAHVQQAQTHITAVQDIQTNAHTAADGVTDATAEAVSLDIANRLATLQNLIAGAKNHVISITNQVHDLASNLFKEADSNIKTISSLYAEGLTILAAAELQQCTRSRDDAQASWDKCENNMKSVKACIARIAKITHYAKIVAPSLDMGPPFTDIVLAAKLIAGYKTSINNVVQSVKTARQQAEDRARLQSQQQSGAGNGHSYDNHLNIYDSTLVANEYDQPQREALARAQSAANPHQGAELTLHGLGLRVGALEGDMKLVLKWQGEQTKWQEEHRAYHKRQEERETKHIRYHRRQDKMLEAICTKLEIPWEPESMSSSTETSAQAQTETQTETEPRNE